MFWDFEIHCLFCGVMLRRVPNKKDRKQCPICGAKDAIFLPFQRTGFVELFREENVVTYMSKKSKKSLAAQLHKEKARNVIAQPKPTAVRSGSASGNSRQPVYPKPESYSGILAEKLEEAGFVRMSPPIKETHMPGAPRLADAASLRVHVPVERVAPRVRHEKAVTIKYSQEVIQHAEFLRRTEGEKSMNDYLRSVKQMSTQPITKQENEEMDKSQTSPPDNFGIFPDQACKPKVEEAYGGIESELIKAEAKIRFHTKEIERNNAEITRYQLVADSLRTALNTIRGVVSVPQGNKAVSRRGTHSGMAVRGFWTESIINFMNIDKTPKTQDEIIDSLKAIRNKERATVYAAIHSAIKKGDILIEAGNGKYGLGEWTKA